MKYSRQILYFIANVPNGNTTCLPRGAPSTDYPYPGTTQVPPLCTCASHRGKRVTLEEQVTKFENRMERAENLARIFSQQRPSDHEEQQE